MVDSRKMYLITIGQLKRIQEIIHRDWKLEIKQRRTITEHDIKYILRGKGNKLPIWINEKPISTLKNTDESNSILLNLEKVQELKLRIVYLNGYNLSNPK